MWLVAAVAVMLSLPSLLGLIAISQHTEMQIEEGMTRQELIQIAGRPHQIGSDETWYYNVWRGPLPVDSLIVGFDDNGVVNGVSPH